MGHFDPGVKFSKTGVEAKAAIGRRLTDLANRLARRNAGLESLMPPCENGSHFWKVAAGNGQLASLPVAAKCGNRAVSRKLLELGADVNARAAKVEEGVNGHIQLFHTANSNAHRSTPVMKVLLQAGARTGILLHGLTWVKGSAWEASCFEVTPITYAQFALLPQMQRTERDCYENNEPLLQASGRPIPPLENVPNRYLVE